MKKLFWFFKTLFGKKYFIKYTNKLKNDEILIIGHKIYVSKRKDDINETK